MTGDEKKEPIGASWVVRARPALEAPDREVFDELAVDDWIHIEYMDEGHYWARIGDARLDIFISPGEPVRVMSVAAIMLPSVEILTTSTGATCRATPAIPKGE